MILHGPDNPGCRLLCAFFIESAGGESTAFSCFCACVVYELLQLCISFCIFVRISAKDQKNVKAREPKCTLVKNLEKLMYTCKIVSFRGPKHAFRDPSTRSGIQALVPENLIFSHRSSVPGNLIVS